VSKKSMLKSRCLRRVEKRVGIWRHLSYCRTARDFVPLIILPLHRHLLLQYQSLCSKCELHRNNNLSMYQKAEVYGFCLYSHS
jgi:hypothetical protein